MPKLTLIVAVHGILTGRSLPTWPERLELWSASALPDVTVLTDHYRAGPLPLWNVGVQNPRAARNLLAVVENYLDGYDPADVAVHFVGHSNGCDIIRRASIRLMRRGYKVASVLMFSAPCHSSVERMGFRPYIDDGSLGRLVVYAADEDRVLAPIADWRNPITVLHNAIRWPYGNAGRVGLTDGEQWVVRNGPEITARTATRLFPGWGHGDFFPLANPGRMAGMFETIARDSGLKPR